MPENSRETVSTTPVSILANKGAPTGAHEPRPDTLAAAVRPQPVSTQNSQESVPRYRPLEERRYANPQKLQVVTARKSSENSPQKSMSSSGSIASTPMSALKTPQTALHTAVSFTLDNLPEKISHRGSISARPSSVALSNQSQPAPAPAPARHDENSFSDSSNPSSRQNSIHMPGDFIFFESKNQHHPPTPAAAKKYHHTNKAVIDALIGPQVPFTEFFQKQDDEKIHILIGATGSVATIKVPLIIDKLFKYYGPEKVSIQLVVTSKAEHFLRGLKISTDVKIWRDQDEWFGFKRMGDPVLHTELRRWADVCLIAPLSANTLAKLANGICDNLLTSLLRSWTPSTPVLVAPAMNTFMYTHPVTKKHLTMLEEDAPYVTVLKPVEKVLVCGDIGMGGMREWNDIVDVLIKKIVDIRRSRADLKAMDLGEKDGDDFDDDDDDDDDEEEEEDDDDNENDDDTDSNDSGVDEDYDDDDDDDPAEREEKENKIIRENEAKLRHS
ncbi:LAFE_0C13168g1_1 [Lachancea fermentati]|uniref:LAFE_0C13168g1_1 n=1 Tax=Lachancea fermentati TaxID=4955 RepID=A0A1G4MAM8_LACFM|nr:LAFE_0C13168g1_1 [Lachancea fermentati]